MKPSDYGAQASDYKICPMLFGLERYATFEGVAIVNRPCTGPRCAWWDARREKCGILPKA